MDAFTTESWRPGQTPRSRKHSCPSKPTYRKGALKFQLPNTTHHNRQGTMAVTQKPQVIKPASSASAASLCCRILSHPNPHHSSLSHFPESHHKYQLLQLATRDASWNHQNYRTKPTLSTIRRICSSLFALESPWPIIAHKSTCTNDSAVAHYFSSPGGLSPLRSLAAVLWQLLQTASNTMFTYSHHNLASRRPSCFPSQHNNLEMEKDQSTHTLISSEAQLDKSEMRSRHSSNRLHLSELQLDQEIDKVLISLNRARAEMTQTANNAAVDSVEVADMAQAAKRTAKQMMFLVRRHCQNVNEGVRLGFQRRQSDLEHDRDRVCFFVYNVKKACLGLSQFLSSHISMNKMRRDQRLCLLQDGMDKIDKHYVYLSLVSDF